MYVEGVGGWTDRVMTWHPVHGECEALIATIVLSERNAHNWLSGLSLVVISLYVQQLFYRFVLKQSELLSSCFNYSTAVLLLIKEKILLQPFLTVLKQKQNYRTAVLLRMFPNIRQDFTTANFIDNVMK